MIPRQSCPDFWGCYMGYSPQISADRGEQIYQQKYKAKLEAENPGQYVAIDIDTENIYLGSTPEEALGKAQKQAPRGQFHLIRIGSAGVYRVGYSSGGQNGDWLFR